MDTLFVQADSSKSSLYSYDVFLSFRGTDTRKTFTGHLYSRLCQVGINTFIDDEELRKGEVISKELEKAIEESRVSIVVFSKNYASSKWCLDELVKILECKEKFGAQRIEKWTAALTEAANLSGWDLQNVADGYEFKFIENIMEQVLQEVNQTPIDVAWYPVGVDTRVKDIELLLGNECVDEVHMVGIYGVGGIGKTTLAKAIYNRTFLHFDSSCFLSNVRSEAETFDGLLKLQEKLLHQILKTKDFKVNSVDEGIKLIRTRLRSKKVLIVLDDVDHKRQLESLTRERSWFGSGSFIIITTRDEHLLCRLKENERYEAKLFNADEAMQLFSSHAFNSLFPPQEYVELAQDIIKYSDGLPLALVTLGSHLQGRSLEEWRDEIKKLRAIPHSDIQRILKISFDGLDGDTQSVFLDIACAFHGFSKEEVTKTLNACGFHSESAIATLVRRCLLHRDGHCLMMHDLVRDMGREIVRMESPQDSGRRSRLFNPQEVRDVLVGNKGSKKVEVLMVDPRALKGVNLSTKAFKKMKNLRVLKIDELAISGDLELLSKELRWLSWKKCPLKCIPSGFPTEKLVFLDMRGSNIQEFGLNLQCCINLRKLDLSDCKHLRKTPNFNGSRSLETLQFFGCSSLTEIHQSIGNLDRLISLQLGGCKKLMDLPSSICHLKSLKKLDISWCSSIQTLPLDLGDMQSLEGLYAGNTGIKELPGSVEMLRNLAVLIVGTTFSQKSSHRMQSLSRRVHPVQSLSTSVFQLNLSYCGLSEADIPRNIESLSSLRYLDLSGNSFRCLPFGFTKLHFLRSLYFKDCVYLQTLPPVSNLEYLQRLELANCKRLVKIAELDNLPSIDYIDMVNCSSLQNPINEGFFNAPALAFPSRKDGYRWSEIHHQSNEIPGWCSNQVTASSICFTMPTDNEEYKFIGMILWFVRKFVNVPFSSSARGFSFSIADKMYPSFSWPFDYHRLPAGYVERSCVLYIPYLQSLFEGCQMKCGEKIEVLECGKEDTVKKIGIHLLYLDQHGKVTSLPAVLDNSANMKRSQEMN